MSRITKEIAAEVAKKLLEQKVKKNAERYSEIQKIVVGIIQSRTPMLVMQNFSQHKNYINTADYVYLTGPGLNHDYIVLGESVPYDSSMSRTIILEESTSMLLSKKLEKYQIHRKKNEELKEKTEATIYALRTYKKVKDLFPDAYKFLPPENTATCTDLQCISSIIQEINNENE